MAEKDDFHVNLLRMIAAELHMQTCMNVSREMFGKGYFALGAAEKQTVDQSAFSHIAANYQALTREFLAEQKVQQPMGFVVPKTEQ